MTPVLEPTATIQAAQFVNVITRAEVTHGYRLDLPEEGATFAPGFAVRRAPDGTLGLAVVAEEPDPALHRVPQRGEKWMVLPGARSSADCWRAAPVGHVVTIVDPEDDAGDFFVRSIETSEDGWVLRAFLAPVEA